MGNRRWPSSRAGWTRGGRRARRVEWKVLARRGVPTNGNNFIHRRVLVFASLVGARRRALADPMAPSGASGSPSAEGVDSDPARVRYLAFLLDDVSRCSLLDWVAELSGGHPGADDDGWTVHADHVTVAHRDASGFDAALASFPWGMACEMRVLGIAGDARARGPRRGARLRAIRRGCPRHRRVRPGRRPSSRRHARRGHRVRRVPRHLRGCPAHPHRKTRRRHRRGRPRLPAAHARDRDEAVSKRLRRARRRRRHPSAVAHLWRRLDALATTTDDDDDSNRGWLSAGAPGGYLTVAASFRQRPRSVANLGKSRVRQPRRDQRRDSNRRRTEHPAGVDAEDVAASSWTRWRGRSRTRRAALAATLAGCGWDANRAAEVLLFGEDAADSSARGRDVDSVDGGVSNDATGGSWAEWRARRWRWRSWRWRRVSVGPRGAPPSSAEASGVDIERRRASLRPPTRTASKTIYRRFVGDGRRRIGRAFPRRPRAGRPVVPQRGGRPAVARVSARSPARRSRAATARRLGVSSAPPPSRADGVGEGARGGGGDPFSIEPTTAVCRHSRGSAVSRGRRDRDASDGVGGRRGRTRGRCEWCAGGEHSVGGRARVAPAVVPGRRGGSFRRRRRGDARRAPRDAMKEPPPRE